MPHRRAGYKRLTTSGVAVTGPNICYGFLLSSNSANASATLSNHGGASLTAAHSALKVATVYMSAPGTDYLSLEPGVGLQTGAHVSMVSGDYCTVFFRRTSSRGW